MSEAFPKLVTASPHADGAAHLAFSPDGQFLYTTGDEGYMRIFDASGSGSEAARNPVLVEQYEEPVTSVSTSEGFWVASCDDGQVKVMTAGKDELARALTRCTLAVRSARFDHKGKWIVVASDEVVIKVVNSANPTQAYMLTGHKKGVRDATWSPDDTLITSTDQDGELRVWEVGSGDPTCIQVFDNLVFAGPTDLALPMGAAWHPSGRFFVVVSKDNEIIQINRDGWTRDGTFSSPNGHTSPISALAWSKNGKYLVTAGKKDNVIVWSESTRAPIIWTKTQNQVTDICFHPTATANTLAWIDNGGHLHQWKDVLPSHLPDPSLVVGARRDRSVSVAASVASRGAGKKSRIVDDLASGDDLGDDDEGEGDVDDVRMEKEDWIDDDLGMDDYAMLDEPVPKRLGGGGGAGDLESYSTPYVSATKGQDPFQPGATPVKDRKRYLAFNLIGNISVIEREDQNIVTVDFFDQSSHLGFHFNDPFKYTLGAIGELGCIFACRTSGDSPATIYHRPYESWSKATEWQYSLSPGENPTALAIGGLAESSDPEAISITGTGAVVVATDRGYLRFFTGSGLQRRVENFGDGEDVVALAASRDWLLVVSRKGPVVDAKQNLEYEVRDLDSFETVQKGKLPMKKGASLKWVGFSDEQIPAFYDSNGVLSLLDLSRHPGQGKWLVALEMHEMARREGKDETYWPIGVNDKHVNAIILKGKENHPGFPTPLFQDLALQFPLLRQDVPQGKLEEQCARETMFITNRRDGASPDDFLLKSTLAGQELEVDKCLLKIIQTACKAENLHAAFDATLLLNQAQSLVAAGKIAAFFHLPALQKRIQRAQDEKSMTSEEREHNQRELKWAHRVDGRVIPAQHASTHGSGAFGGSPALEATPQRSHHVPFRTRVPPSAPSSREARRRLIIEQSARDVGGSDGVEDGDEEMVYESDDENGSSPQKRHHSEDAQGEDEGDEHEIVDEPETMMAPPLLSTAPKSKVNPFKKQAAPPKAPAKAASANPFAGKGITKAKDAKRTNSFFGRVDEPVPKDKKGAKATKTDGFKQMTVFGAAPPPEPVPVAKKRKVVADKDADAPATLKKQGSLFNAAPKPIDLAEDREKRQESETAGEDDAAGPLPAVEEEVEMEDTQVDTQVETRPEKENTPVVEQNDGVSKLEQFRNVATSD